MTYTDKLNLKRKTNQEISPITSSNNGKSNANPGFNFTEESNTTKPLFAINLYDINRQ